MIMNAKELLTVVHFLKQNGLDEYILSDEPQNRLQDSIKVVEKNDQNRDKTHNEWLLHAQESASRSKDLEELKTAVENFSGCNIKELAINTVFSDGNPESDLLIIGEAPGAEEDKQGIPFCGRSGNLLNKMLESIGLSRSNAYITNTVFWRPPGNRKPTTEETDMCKPFLEKHIALVNPKVIFLLGATATSSILNTDLSISKLRGNICEYSNQYLSKPIPAIPSFHPAYLLRQQSQKKYAWEDLKTVKAIINNTYSK